MAWADQILRFAGGVDGRQNGRGAVGGGDTVGHALTRLDGNGKGGAER